VLEIQLMASFLEDTALVKTFTLNKMPYPPVKTYQCKHLVYSCLEPIL